MEAMRDMVISDEKTYKAAKEKHFDKQSVFHLGDSKYCTSRHPEQPEEKREWLDQRSLDFITESEDFDLLFSDALADKLAADFKLLVPMYKFMMARKHVCLKG